MHPGGIMKIKLRYPALALGIVAFFGGIYAYISMNIEASLLEREIRLARYEKRDWERKNSAIRAEVARLEGEGYETIYWKLYGALPFYEDNTIIYVDLESLKPGPGFYRTTVEGPEEATDSGQRDAEPSLENDGGENNPEGGNGEPEVRESVNRRNGDATDDSGSSRRNIRESHRNVEGSMDGSPSQKPGDSSSGQNQEPTTADRIRAWFE